jgi:hypothetical protein
VAAQFLTVAALVADPAVVALDFILGPSTMDPAALAGPCIRPGLSPVALLVREAVQAFHRAQVLGHVPALVHRVQEVYPEVA